MHTGFFDIIYYSKMIMETLCHETLPFTLSENRLHSLHASAPLSGCLSLFQAIPFLTSRLRKVWTQIAHLLCEHRQTSGSYFLWRGLGQWRYRNPAFHSRQIQCQNHIFYDRRLDWILSRRCKENRCSRSWSWKSFRKSQTDVSALFRWMSRWNSKTSR